MRSLKQQSKFVLCSISIPTPEGILNVQSPERYLYLGQALRWEAGRQKFIIFCMLIWKYHNSNHVFRCLFVRSVEAEVKWKLQIIYSFRWGSQFSGFSLLRNLGGKCYTQIKKYHSRKCKHYTLLILIWFDCLSWISPVAQSIPSYLYDEQCLSKFLVQKVSHARTGET